jgi:hypothetical protein
MNALLWLSSRIYLRECLEEAISAYATVCKVRVSSETPDGRHIEVEVSKEVDDRDKTVDEFLNYVLDLSLERHLATPLPRT